MRRGFGLRLAQLGLLLFGLLGAAGSGASSVFAQESESAALDLQQAFNRIAETVGPAVVSISTEQIERVREYYRVNPFYRQNREQFFEEFYRRYEEGAPMREQRRFGLGSGVVIDEAGLILTNDHVVANADKITVTFSDGREVEGVVKAKDRRSDLAVIQVPAENLTVAHLGNSDLVRTGNWAVALGNPFGIVGSGAGSVGPEPTLTVGVISALGRSLPRTPGVTRDYSGLIQTDAAINPGNSGGPLVNIKGEVVGINVAIFSSSQGYEGIGFAIPSNKVQRLLQSLKEGRSVSYGWLGVQVQPLSANLAEYFASEPNEGVLIYTVLPDGPADKAGLEPGDVIVSYGSRPIRATPDLIQAVSSTEPGDTVDLEIVREGKHRSVEVRIGDSESQMTEEPREDEPRVSSGWRGMHVTGVSPVVIERFDLPFETSGVIVIRVEADSAAGRAGIRPGDMILELDRKRIKSLKDYEKRINEVKDNALVKTTRGFIVVETEAP